MYVWCPEDPCGTEVASVGVCTGSDLREDTIAAR